MTDADKEQKPDGGAAWIKIPRNEKDIALKIEDGWFFAFPPEDYTGGIADWCVAMADRGYPEDYGKLTDIMVPRAIWEDVLDECERHISGPTQGHGR